MPMALVLSEVFYSTDVGLLLLSVHDGEQLQVLNLAQLAYLHAGLVEQVAKLVLRQHLLPLVRLLLTRLQHILPKPGFLALRQLVLSWIPLLDSHDPVEHLVDELDLLLELLDKFLGVMVQLGPLELRVQLLMSGLLVLDVALLLPLKQLLPGLVGRVAQNLAVLAMPYLRLSGG